MPTVRLSGGEVCINEGVVECCPEIEEPGTQCCGKTAVGERPTLLATVLDLTGACASVEDCESCWLGRTFSMPWDLGEGLWLGSMSFVCGDQEKGGFPELPFTWNGTLRLKCLTPGLPTGDPPYGFGATMTWASAAGVNYCYDCMFPGNADASDSILALRCNPFRIVVPMNVSGLVIEIAE